MIKVAIVGSGGREAALAQALRPVAEVLVTPGRSSIPGSVDTHPLDLDADLYVIGPEQPLVDGLADRLRAQGKLVFGPGAAGAKLEGSKAWMKTVLDQAGIPTARPYGVFDDQAAAVKCLRAMPPPYVVKTDGLAAGKGVCVTDSLSVAIRDTEDKLSGRSFGEAGLTIVIEPGLSGPELSVLAICDGQNARLLPPARDYKRLLAGDCGAMTGGVGAFSPVTSQLVDDLVLGWIQSILYVLSSRHGIDYRGVMYLGLMLTPEGPKVLEINVRFGDPEAQVVLPRIEPVSLLSCLMEAAGGRLRTSPVIRPIAAVCLTPTASGYPDKPVVGDVISGLEAAAQVEGVTILHAGTEPTDRGYVTAAGRVLNVVGTGPTLDIARRRAYWAADAISWRGMQPPRADIALETANAQP